MSGRITRPNEESIFLVTYSSGTIGIPKGSMLTHLNMIATISTG